MLAFDARGRCGRGTGFHQAQTPACRSRCPGWNCGIRPEELARTHLPPWCCTAALRTALATAFVPPGAALLHCTAAALATAFVSPGAALLHCTAAALATAFVSPGAALLHCAPLQHWQQPLYPLVLHRGTGNSTAGLVGTKADDLLSAYQTKFRWCEINATAYKLPSADQIAKWRKQCAAGFELSLKVPMSITHEHGLREGCFGLLEQFATAVRGLGPFAGA